MIFKIIKISPKFILIGILSCCFFQPRSLKAGREPIIKVLILKDKEIRIRSDKSIPLTITGQRFPNKKFMI